MPDFILRTENLSKQYRIIPTVGQGWRRNQRALAEEISQAINTLYKKEKQDKKISFWALQDVSFEAKQGDIIGVIGRNGAGKSTLLKLLGRITEPSYGRAIIYGRVGSLLEVGTGFHSELTGRENIFISGAILGMPRTEIKKKFDEIVEFSGVEKFLDTPVKRFSSGMEVRLAFSVAAHLQPQILLVDEVLSVGDVIFQQKSLKKIREVADNGGTILFVSHNMNTVASICNQALVLNHGKVAFQLGPVTKAIDHYNQESLQSQQTNLEEGRQSGISGGIKVTRFAMRDENDLLLDTLTTNKPVNFHIEYQADNTSALDDVNVSIHIKTLQGDMIVNLSTKNTMGTIKLSSRVGKIVCSMERLPLAPGNISISLILEQQGQIADRIKDVFVGLVDSGGHYRNTSKDEVTGWLFIEPDWKITS
jgi:lipopolysaccharide transport system ATP-binding protein